MTPLQKAEARLNRLKDELAEELGSSEMDLVMELLEAQREVLRLLNLNNL